MSKQVSLAKIVDEDSLVEFQKRDELLQVVNLNPPESFIKNHPLASGVKYLPIDKVELMLTKLFQQWRVEVLREGQLLNSVYVAVRLHYLDPIAKEWTSQDGLGAVQIQVDKGENASNLAAIKSDAIMKGLPAAESFAVKDAAEKIGKLFGRDLNRRDALDFTPSYATEEKKQTVKDGIAKAVEKAKQHEDSQTQPTERSGSLAATPQG